MFRKSNQLVPVNYFLKPGYIFVSNRPSVISAVLGSCVAICLYDKKRKIGGMNNFQLPQNEKRESSTARYGNVATLALIKMMIDEGSSIKNIEAQIFGGAFNPAQNQKDVGRENVQVARKILLKKGIRIVSEDVGGQKGRKVVFHTKSNEVAVLRVDELRNSDWYPYQEDR